MVGAFLLKNPPAGYKPAGWKPAAASKSAATTYEFSPGEVLRTPTFYLMWVAYALGCSAGLMVISQLVPFARSVGIAAAALSTMTLVVGAFGNASGRILSGWMSDKLGRINVLRIMIGISMIAMPALYAAGGNVAAALPGGIRGLLVLRHAALGERRRHGGLLGHQERRHQLRHAVHRLGRGRHHRPAHWRNAVRQVS